MRKLTLSILAGATALALPSSLSAQTATVVQGQGPNFLTHISASTSNTQNNNVQVFGSTTGVGGADVLFTGNTAITITNGNGFASIGDSALPGTFTSLIIDPAPLFTALQFNLSLDSASFLQVDFRTSPGGAFITAIGSGISQNGNANTGYTITAAAGTTFDAIRLTSCLTATACNLATTGAGSGNGAGINFERQNSIQLAQVAAVPEPATWAMMLIGFGAVGASVRRKRRVTLLQAA